jgi:hypothetical protein
VAVCVPKGLRFVLALVMGRVVTVSVQRGALDFILAAWLYLDKAG